MARYLFTLSAFAGTAVLLAGCAQDTPEIPDSTEGVVEQEMISPVDPSILASGDDDLYHWQFQSLQSCQNGYAYFQEAALDVVLSTDQLLSTPSAEHLNTAQTRWREAVEAWGAADLCTQKPLLTDGQSSFADRYQRTAAAPVLPGYIDAIPGYSDTGLVHDNTVALSLESLITQHQLSFEEEVALGLYALEVLLFGVMPREPWDFNSSEGGTDSMSRRAAILRLVAADLLTQAEIWQDHWPARVANMRQTYSPTYELTWLIDNWVLALQKIGRAQQVLRNGDPALSLNEQHDALRFKGSLEHLALWWHSPGTLAVIEKLDLDTSAWTAIDVDQMTVHNSTAAEWERLGNVLTTLTAQLALLRQEVENHWHTKVQVR
ncbi:imelysin family protein [Salinispirillum sp. LH 10-3-1]|uniref:Imelysin family protein n=1 Tax=Salinispirillum sp. LH 10-3-1 TaxID=2952525 RepID=A0AB38YH47_9GAMM